MRQRKPKDLDNRINECERFIVRDPGPGAWEWCFDASVQTAQEEPGSVSSGGVSSGGESSGSVSSGGVSSGGQRRKLFVEIGCGKGDFILAKAIDDPDNNYLGIEGQESVLLRALEKAMWVSESAEEARALGNLRFAGVYVKSMKDLFEEGSLSGIYLNFSDPWPKKRHYKRRLTWRGRLKEYAWALEEGGSIEIKTDNDDLFEFTMEEVEALGWKPAEITRDLHSTDLEARQTMTEYEKKFHNRGKSINYMRIQF